MALGSSSSRFDIVQPVLLDKLPHGWLEPRERREQVLADLIERIDIAPQPRHLGVRLGLHLVVEHAISQRLGCEDVVLAARQA